VLNIKFNPPKQDPLLKDIVALKGIGQWVESNWDLKITGGFIQPGKQDLEVYQITLWAYAEQI